jgi:hypothetical protein
MEEGTNVKANLIIAMQTQSTSLFSEIIKSTNIPLYNLKDSSGCNIFHEIAGQILREDLLLSLFEILINEFNDRYFDESAAIIQSMLDEEKKSDKNTPFLDCVLYNRKVNF